MMRNRTGRPGGGALIWCFFLAISGSALPAGEASRGDKEGRLEAPAAGADVPGPEVVIRFRGFLPGTINSKLQGTFRVQFKIYKSPQGGQPIWKEEQEVEVAGGRMDVALGKKNRIPMEIHQATFKFLGASVNGRREIYPRYPIVNVVYASSREALLGIAGRKVESAPPEKTGGAAPVKVTVEKGAGKKAKWIDALLAARKAGGDLPGYEEWYRALEECSPDDVLERTGRYEWVLPWVYDTASHGRFNRYFRGRFQGCDYMDLSPRNEYHYRISWRDHQSKAGS